jgi:hypothetical protein
VWPIVLSDRLPIVALVGRYPANELIGRRPPRRRLAALGLDPYAVLAPVSQGCPPPPDTFLRVPHPSAADEGRSPRPRDLHVLSMPPAFALSQDQTLRFIPDAHLNRQTGPGATRTGRLSTSLAPRTRARAP